jgi:hypothetical protein
VQDKTKNVRQRNKSFERVEHFRYFENNLAEKNSILERKNQEQFEITESLISFGAEYFVFQVSVCIYEGYDKRNVIFLWLCRGDFTGDPWFKTRSQFC